MHCYRVLNRARFHKQKNRIKVRHYPSKNHSSNVNPMAWSLHDHLRLSMVWHPDKWVSTVGEPLRDPQTLADHGNRQVTQHIVWFAWNDERPPVAFDGIFGGGMVAWKRNPRSTKVETKPRTSARCLHYLEPLVAIIWEDECRARTQQRNVGTALSGTELLRVSY